MKKKNLSDCKVKVNTSPLQYPVVVSDDEGNIVVRVDMPKPCATLRARIARMFKHAIADDNMEGKA